MNPDIADSERLAIFVLDSDDLKADGAHARAFRPGKDRERSFFRIDGLEFAEIAKKGSEVAAKRGKTLCGWAVVLAGNVPQPLAVKSDPEIDRHGMIVGWPTEKHEERNLAQSLADIAETTVRYPAPLDS